MRGEGGEYVDVHYETWMYYQNTSKTPAGVLQKLMVRGAWCWSEDMLGQVSLQPGQAGHVPRHVHTDGLLQHGSTMFATHAQGRLCLGYCRRYGKSLKLGQKLGHVQPTL